MPSAKPRAEQTEDFIVRMRASNLAPGWKLFGKYFPREPRPDIVAAHWPYASTRPLLLEACALMTAEDAERRVLTLENPGMPGEARVTRTLVASLQIVMPGEVARAHRHSAQAFRLILEGEQAYTTINGERAVMRRGDHVLTPSWSWHDHHNSGADNIIFLDGLDVHLVNSFDACFFEPFTDIDQKINRAEGLIEAEAGHNMLAMNRDFDRRNTPLLNYSFVQTMANLEALAAQGDIDTWHGHRMKFLNPLTGGWVTQTIATTVRLLPKAFETRPYRSTEGAIFVVQKGRGQSLIGDTTIEWQEGDVFVAPPWKFQQHASLTDAIVFAYSDRAAQEALGLFREERAWVLPDAPGA